MGGDKMENSNELYHYGRLGMKWGEHIYLNRYGGLKPSGRTRVKKLESEHDSLSRIKRLSKHGVKRKADIEKEYEHLTGTSISERVKEPRQSTGVQGSRSKSVHEMTNEELQAYNTRKQLETTYQNYQPKPQISKGKQFVQAVGSKVIAPVAIEVGKKYLTKVAMDAMKLKASPATVKKVTNGAEQVAKATTK